MKKQLNIFILTRIGTNIKEGFLVLYGVLKNGKNMWSMLLRSLLLTKKGF